RDFDPRRIQFFAADFFRLRRRGGEERVRFTPRAADDFLALAPGLGENFFTQSFRRILIWRRHLISFLWFDVDADGFLRQLTQALATGQRPVRSGNLDDQ